MQTACNSSPPFKQLRKNVTEEFGIESCGDMNENTVALQENARRSEGQFYKPYGLLVIRRLQAFAPIEKNDGSSQRVPGTSAMLRPLRRRSAILVVHPEVSVDILDLLLIKS